MNKVILIAAIGFLSCIISADQKSYPPPQNLRAVFAEKSIELFWDSIPQVIGYNAYTSTAEDSVLKHFRKINPNMISSGARYTYIWDLIDKKHVPGIKGIEHHLAVTAVYAADGDTAESALSRRIDTRYFTGYDKMIKPDRIKKILVDSQRIPRKPFAMINNNLDSFLVFMHGPGKLLDSLLRANIDPQEVGGCSPIATITMLLMHKRGIEAYKGEGTFIKEYHAFNIIMIDSVEYVVDFSANQFVPDVSPVMVPRNKCFLDSLGRLADTGAPVYQAARLYTTEQSSLADDKSSELYRAVYDKVLAYINKPAILPAKKLKKRK
jgi:hypothetical protein